MAAPIVQTVATSTGSGSTLTVTMPASVAAGDLLIVAISINTNRTFTAPGGWTLLYDDADNAAVHRLGTWYRIATGSEGSSVDWTLNIGSNFNASALRISGAHGTTPENTKNHDTTASNLVSPSVTTTVADCLIWRVYSVGRDKTSITEPASHTLRTSELTAAGCDQATATITQATADATGTATWSFSGGSNDRTVHQVMAIAPAAASGVVGPLVGGRLIGGHLTRGRLIRA